MAELYEELGLTAEEYEKIVDVLGREPNNVELGMYSVMWSEHCSYKTSKLALRLLPSDGPRVLQGPGENAGAVDIGDGMAAVFKMESHNHPSAVEPFQGAATGVGGIVRDIFTMGARPIALADPLRFGSLENPRTRYLFDGVVAGIAAYGNCLGIPTIGGDIYFEEAYEENPLVNVMCLGVMPHENLIRGVAAGEGNIAVLIGSSTGRDGIGGVSVLASQEFDESSAAKRPSVQVGDPFTEKLLIEACLELLERGLLVGLQDFGGAGLTCATCETAHRGEAGMKVYLDRVPLREPGMLPVEIMMSESQERMLAICTPEDLDEVKGVCEKWGLPVNPVGEVIEEDRIQVVSESEVVAEVPASSLADGPEYKRPLERPGYLDEVSRLPVGLKAPEDLGETLMRLLSSPNICSRRWVFEQYDHMVETNTISLPGSDAAVIRVKGTDRALALSCDGNGRYCYLDPYTGAQVAVAEGARNVAASGAEPIGITNCLNFGNPERPEIFWQFQQAVEGMADACGELSLPVVSGNVSFYNESFGQAIYPTPVIGMLGLIEHASHQLKAGFREEGDKVVLLGSTMPEIGGSEYLRLVHDLVAGQPPRVDWDAERALIGFLLDAASRSLLSSAHDCSEGGLAVALAEACLLGGLGASVALETGEEPHVYLFSESQSRAVVSLSRDNWEKARLLAEEKVLPYMVLGEVRGDHLEIEGLVSLALPEMSEVYFDTLAKRVAGAHH